MKFNQTLIGSFIRTEAYKIWRDKLLFTLISVKVWGLIACTWVSTHLLVAQKIENEQWLTFNTTIWALIYGMKEIFRISEKRDEAVKENLNLQLDSKEKIVSMQVNPSQNNPKATTFSPDGFEIVGTEPDA